MGGLCGITYCHCVLRTFFSGNVNSLDTYEHGCLVLSYSDVWVSVPCVPALYYNSCLAAPDTKLIDSLTHTGKRTIIQSLFLYFEGIAPYKKSSSLSFDCAAYCMQIVYIEYKNSPNDLLIRFSKFLFHLKLVIKIKFDKDLKLRYLDCMDENVFLLDQ